MTLGQLSGHIGQLSGGHTPPYKGVSACRVRGFRVRQEAIGVEQPSHQGWALPLPRAIHILDVFTGEGRSAGGIGGRWSFFVQFRKVAIRWAFDVGRVRRFAGLLCFIFAPTRLAVSLSAELAAYHVSHIARSKLVYGASPAPSLAALRRAVMSALRAERCVNAAR